VTAVPPFSFQFFRAKSWDAGVAAMDGRCVVDRKAGGACWCWLGILVVRTARNQPQSCHGVAGYFGFRGVHIVLLLYA
jgi:hypothetical protein